MSSDEDDLDLNDDTTSQLDNATDDGDAMDIEDPLPSARSSPAPQQELMDTSTSQRRRLCLSISPEARNCQSYDCVPHVAAIHPNPIYSLAATRCYRWIFTGSDDGYVRKWDFFASMNGKLLLTQAQRHQHVESVSMAGVLSSWWEHEEHPEPIAKIEPVDSIADESIGPQAVQGPLLEPKASPVYSMDVHAEALWMVLGCDNGSINLVTVRHEEGKCRNVLRHHKGPVSVLKITPSETGVISGSWDRTVAEWDLHTGTIVRSYNGHNSQIASVAFQPIYTPYVPTATPKETQDKPTQDTTDLPEAAPTDPSLIWDQKNPDILLTTSVDGQCLLWDRREPSSDARKLGVPERTPPWCLSACWSADGTKIYAGRRNGTVDEYDYGSQKHIQTFRMPSNSGPVSYVSSMPNGKHLICASNDNVRLWNTSLDSAFTIRPGVEQEFVKPSKTPSIIPFIILPGHHGGVISHIFVDPTCRYMITTSGNRGWEGGSTNACLFYDISPVV
ncbi:WD40-repeat-containing domain protein [Phycomyces nitens]|nr:WD40-repeat-containing domain protein [Phycomyces nitens]